MDEDDFLALISELKAQFLEIGASELADEDNYTSRDENTGEDRLLEPRERLIAMLHAFDRFLAVRDGSTFRNAMSRIRQFTNGGGPERVLFLPVADESVRGEADLSDVPDLSQVRRSVALLIEQLHSEPEPRPRGGAL
jgi:hypothetical protein